MSLYLGSEKVENVTAQITLPVEPSDDLPLANGTASAGVSKKFSRADHVHPINEDSVLLADTNIKLPLSEECNDITYGNGKFIAVGRGSIAAYSIDAIHWTEVTLPLAANRTAITYGGGKFVAVSANKGIIYSTDGINWTSIDFDNMWESVIYGNGKFIITNMGGNQIAYSVDGINWNISSSMTTRPYSVAYGNNKFVAISGYNSVAQYSTDGINWELADKSSTGSWNEVIYNAGKFVAIGNGNTAIYSTDGINWTTTTLPSNVNWTSIAYGNDKFVAINYNNNTAIYSTDGINWTTTSLPLDTGWKTITYGDGKFIAVSKDKSNGIVVYSTDGINWNSTTKGFQLPNGTDIHEQVKNALQITASDVNAIPSTLSGTAGQVLTKTASGQEWKDVASPQPSTMTPLPPISSGSGSVGNSINYARGNHRHPSELFICNVTASSSTLTCDQAYNSIKEAFSAGKVCVLNYKGYPFYLLWCLSYAVQFGTLRHSTFEYVTINASDNGVNYTTEELATTSTAKPTARKVTLTISGWSNNQQTVTCTGVSALATSQEIRVMPADATKTSAYVSCGVSCVAQASNKLTFACDKIPTTAIDVYVVMQSLNFQG